MVIEWQAEMEQAVERAGNTVAHVHLRGEAYVLLSLDDYDWVRGLVRGVPDASRVLDPDRLREYAVLPLRDYERIKPLFEEDPITLEERKAALRAAGLRAGWNDPVWDDLEMPPS